MKALKEYLIPFVGLKIGKHTFDFQIDNSFFKHFSFEEYEEANVVVDLVFNKKETLLELEFSHNGTVKVPCDVTNESFDLPINGTLKLIVRFGDVFNNDNEELLILPHGEFQVDVSQYIYEMIVLSVPLKRVHPGVADGSIELPEYEELYEEVEEEQNEEEEIDPRWAELKKLLTDK